MSPNWIVQQWQYGSCIIWSMGNHTWCVRSNYTLLPISPFLSSAFPWIIFVGKFSPHKDIWRFKGSLGEMGCKFTHFLYSPEFQKKKKRKIWLVLMNKNTKTWSIVWVSKVLVSSWSLLIIYKFASNPLRK